MIDVVGTVQSHYGRRGLLARIDTALAASGLDPQKITPQDLWPFDQLHGRGIIATREHAERAYELGFSLPGLRKRLEAAGQWTPKQPPQRTGNAASK
jgi:hypothetical protein